MHDWKLTLLMMPLTPIHIICAGVMSKILSKAAWKESENSAKASAIIEEVISSIKTVFAFNGQDCETKRYVKALKKNKKECLTKSIYTGIGMAVSQLTVYCSYALAFWIGTISIANGEIEPSVVFTVLFSIIWGSMSLALWSLGVIKCRSETPSDNLRAPEALGPQ
uniref:ABC transmembrane type-1 domain-containing protein n=1 Tax=Acrobeloides nanus TaxID=290746 RepID=A0A914D6V6_9BILA